MNTQNRPYTLIAELTYRCALHCAYCSNPPDFQQYRAEIDTNTWLRVFREAEALGVVQLNLTGGEPLLREDLESLIEEAHKLSLYINLITSGVPLTRERLIHLRDAGLNSVQLSFQSVDAPTAKRMCGLPVLHQKLTVAEWVKALDLPLTINTVLHRENLHEVAEIITMAERLEADRLELANVQYLGWALRNRQALLPTREQLHVARQLAREAKERLAGVMEVIFVTPDYYAEFPKTCMGGWGQQFLLVTPNGLALPCHLAHTISGLQFDSVEHHSLEEIWFESPGFNQFRGEAWMEGPCRTCERRHIDFGGCRCQAFHLTGLAGTTDPACSLSPDHHLIETAQKQAQDTTGSLITVEYRQAKILDR
jgi:pyrroloquinoline quinone biosynthesis protein E